MSVQAIRRDYSLSGGNRDAVELDGDRIQGRLEDQWWKPRLSRRQMREIMQRRDGPGLWHFGLWFLLLGVSAYLAFISWGTWWAVPAFFVYGTIYTSADSRWHESGHGTPFRTRWLNEFVYAVASFLGIREAYMWRWSHSRHHTHTYFVGRDPEIQVQRPADLVKLLMDFFYLRSGPPEVWRLIRNACGRPNADVRDFVPERDLKKMLLVQPRPRRHLRRIHRLVHRHRQHPAHDVRTPPPILRRLAPAAPQPPPARRPR